MKKKKFLILATALLVATLSIGATISRVYDLTRYGAVKLPSCATASLPDATLYTQCFLYDSTTNTIKYSNGTTWGAVGSAATADSIYNGGAWTVDVDGAGALGDVIFRMSATDVNMLFDTNVTGTSANLLVLDAKHASATITKALEITTTGATAAITTAVDLSDAGIVTALSTGANDLTGTYWGIAGATGKATFVGCEYGTGTLTGSGSVAVNTTMFTVDGTNGDTVIAGDASVGGALAVTGNITGTFTGTWGGSTWTANPVITESATTGVGMTITGDTVTTGDILRLHCDASLSSGHFLRCLDVAAEKFAVAEDGGVTIAGTAAGSDAIRVTAGDLTLTSGNIVQTAGDNTMTLGNLELTAGNLTMALGLFDISGTASNADLMDIVRSNTATGGDALDIDMGTAVIAGDAIDILFGAGAGTGDAITVNMGSNVAGGVLTATVAGARTDALIDITDTSTSNSPSIDINNDGIRTGNGLDITYGTAAASENAVDLNMGTNVAGMAISVASAATGTGDEGSALDVKHTGDLAAGADLVRLHSSGDPSSTSNMLSIEQDTGAGTAGAYGLYISCAGTNVEALNVAAGTSTFAELVTLGGGARLEDNDTIGFGTASAEGTIGSNGTNTLWTIASGGVQVGTPGSNYTNIASTGAITFAGTAMLTKKAFLPANAFTVHTGTPALGVVGTGAACAYAMDAAADESVTINWQVPDNWAAATDITVKIMWCANDANTTDVCFDLFSLKLAEDEVVNAAGAQDSVTDTEVSATAYDLNITAAQTIAAAEIAAGDFVSFRLNRDADNVADTLAADLLFLGLEITYTADKP